VREIVNESRPLPRRLVRALVVVGLLGLATAGFAAFQLYTPGEPRFHGTIYPDAPPAPAFSLFDHEGRTTSLADFRGRPVLLFFGFSRCPDVCPRTLARVSRVLNEAGISPDVQLLLVTVDPEHDTPERLARYVEPFGGRVRGLTGDRAGLEALFAEYGVYAREADSHDGHPTISHTSLLFGVDPAGRLRVLIHADEPDEVIQSDVRALLRLRG